MEIVYIPRPDLFGILETLLVFYFGKVGIDALIAVVNMFFSPTQATPQAASNTNAPKARTLAVSRGNIIKLGILLTAFYVWAASPPSRRLFIAFALIVVTYGDDIVRWLARKLRQVWAHAGLTRRHTLLVLFVIVILVIGTFGLVLRTPDDLITSGANQLPAVQSLVVDVVNIVYDTIEQPSALIEPVLRAVQEQRTNR